MALAEVYFERGLLLLSMLLLLEQQEQQGQLDLRCWQQLAGCCLAEQWGVLVVLQAAVHAAQSQLQQLVELALLGSEWR